MTETNDPTASAPPPYGTPAPAPTGGVPVPAMAGGPLAPMAGPADGPIGKIRSTGVCILLAIITFGIYSIYWFFKTHDEMKRHSGQGVGGGIALILALFIGIVMPYINSSEVGGLYERKGMKRPVSGATGLWYFPGMFILIGPLVWFIKTNGALNAYWRSQGASA